MLLGPLRLQTPQLRAVLEEDLSAYLDHLLVEHGALNLRNRIGHGQIKVDDCTRLSVQRALHCFLLVVKFGIEGDAQQ